MNFDLTEDQRILTSVVDRFVDEKYSQEARREYLASELGFSADNWALLGELGVIATAFDEADGGLAAEPATVAAMFEALGRGLVVEPLIDNAYLAGWLLARGNRGPSRDADLGPLLTGEKRVAFAHAEAAARQNPHWIETRARKESDGFRLSGTKTTVAAGSGADGYIVTARTSGAPDDVMGVELFFVPAGARGLRVQSYRLIDGTVACDLTLDDVRAESRLDLPEGRADRERARTRATLARCAEALGVMQTLFDGTLEHLRTRRQFGRHIGAFQALQHRMVTQYTHVEQARSLLHAAVFAGESGDPEAYARAVAGAHAYIGEVGVQLGHEAIQLFGGMGISNELFVGGAHKRLFVLSRFPVDAAYSLDVYAGVVKVPASSSSSRDAEDRNTPANPRRSDPLSATSP